MAKDHIYVYSSFPTIPDQHISQIVQWLKGTSSRVLLQEFPHLRKQLWGRHVLPGLGYLAVSSGTITDKMVEEYIAQQEGEPIHDDSQLQLTIIRSYRLPGGSGSLALFVFFFLPANAMLGSQIYR